MRTTSQQKPQLKDNQGVQFDKTLHLHAQDSTNTNDKTIDSNATTNFKHSFSNMPVHAGGPVVQTKLSVNEAGDKYEQEADAMADKVMKMSDKESLQTKPSPVNIQRKCAVCEEDENKKINRKCFHCEEEERIQMKKESIGSATMTASSTVQDVINSRGQPLDVGTRGFMESRFGFDFGNVQIHNDALSHQSSADINALAYTHANHVVFGAGQYKPNTKVGKHLLAHELTHVVQQSTIKTNEDIIRINEPGDSFEKEADTAAIESGHKTHSASRVLSPMIQRSFGSMLLDVALFIPRLFGLEVFTAEQLRDYLKELKEKKGPVGSLFSDNKARACVSREQEFGPYDTKTKTWLIEDMLQGYTSFLDEDSIITLLRRSTDKDQIVQAIGREELWSNFSGDNRYIIEAMTMTKADAGDALVSKLRRLSADKIKLFDSNAIDPDVKESARRALALTKITAPVPSSADITATGEANLDINGVHVSFLPDSIDSSLGQHAFTYSEFHHDGLDPIIITPANANLPTGEIPPLQISVSIYTKYPSEESKGEPSKYGAGTRPGDENTLQFHESSHGQGWIDFLTKNPPPVFKGTNGMLPAQFNTAVDQYEKDIKAYEDRAHDFALKAGDCVGTLPTDQDYEGTGFKAAICH